MQRNWNSILFTVAALGLTSMLLAWAIEGFSMQDESYGNVAVVPIKGVIMSSQGTGLFDPEAADSSTIINFIEKADSDPSIKAIMLDIDSPGGSPVATDEIARAVKNANKTTIAVIHETGASGAFWVATAADTVVANPMSVVGSIGVYSSYLDFSGLMQKYGVTYNRVVGGQYKDMGSPYKELTPEEQTILQSKIDKIHMRFIKAVAENRNLSVERVTQLSTGEFFLGEEAKEYGFVDILGGKEEAITHLEKKLNITVSLVEYHQKESFLSMLSSLMAQQSYRIGEGIGHGIVKQDLTIRT
jgi:protease IV